VSSIVNLLITLRLNRVGLRLENRDNGKKNKIKINYELEYYAAFDWRGNILDATIKRTKDEATAALHRFNPPIVSHDYIYEVLPIMIGIDTRQSQQELFKDVE